MTTYWWPHGAHRTKGMEKIWLLTKGDVAHIERLTWHRLDGLLKAMAQIRQSLWHRSGVLPNPTWLTPDDHPCSNLTVGWMPCGTHQTMDVVQIQWLLNGYVVHIRGWVWSRSKGSLKSMWRTSNGHCGSDPTAMWCTDFYEMPWLWWIMLWLQLVWPFLT